MRCPRPSPRHVHDMSATCPRHVRDMSATCPRHVHVHDTPTTCPRHAHDMPTIRPRHARDMSTTCPSHVHRRWPRRCGPTGQTVCSQRWRRRAAVRMSQAAATQKSATTIGGGGGGRRRPRPRLLADAVRAMNELYTKRGSPFFHSSGLVYSTAESVCAALRCGRGVYWSRSRRSLWRKGDSSGARGGGPVARVKIQRLKRLSM